MATLDEQDYAEMLRQSQHKLWTLATAIVGDRNLAEDVVQEAAMVGLRRLAEFDAGTNFEAWISQIVRFTALNHLKSKKRRRVVSLDVHMEVGDAPATEEIPSVPVVTPDGQLAPHQQEFGDQVVNLISEFEPQRRACLLLRVVHGLDYDEIAQIVDVPANTAMSHVHRAKSKLRQALSRSGDGGDASHG